MTRELLSGPDLGGGYLHQLSIDREEGVESFTHHAQEGGDDAGGPPRGPLDRLGFTHPKEPCMFGGPRCWHRVYRLPPSEAGRVRAAYARYRFVLSALLDQVYGGSPRPVASTLRELIRDVAEPLNKEGHLWWFSGSTARWLEGSGEGPEWLEIEVDEAAGRRLAELLSAYLIEPWSPTDWPHRGAVVGARAFLGTPREGLRAEWCLVGLPGGSEPSLPPRSVLRRVDFEGTDLLVDRG